MYLCGYLFVGLFAVKYWESIKGFIMVQIVPSREVLGQVSGVSPLLFGEDTHGSPSQPLPLGKRVEGETGGISLLAAFD